MQFQIPKDESRKLRFLLLLLEKKKTSAKLSFGRRTCVDRLKCEPAKMVQSTHTVNIERSFSRHMEETKQQHSSTGGAKSNTRIRERKKRSSLQYCASPHQQQPAMRRVKHPEREVELISLVYSAQNAALQYQVPIMKVVLLHSSLLPKPG